MSQSVRPPPGEIWTCELCLKAICGEGNFGIGPDALCQCAFPRPSKPVVPRQYATVGIYERIENQRIEIERLRDCLHECAEDLAAELDDRHRSRDQYATIHNAYERDMTPVYRARKLLAALQGSANPLMDGTHGGR